ncbi:GNAT family N-acetyltransferase [Ochrobactrum sp. GPK 3]|uniref:GNAT family N-acetyltransferase n=1 Tax=Brucella sp. 22210 TaxID=3453892 RepID=UPI0031385B40
MRYSLDLVHTSRDWTEIHKIRSEVLFDGFDDGFIYDENHPDDRLPGHFPFILRYDEETIGTARLDINGEIGVVRLVAIAKRYQSKGHGKVLDALIEAEGRKHNLKMLCVNAEPQAVQFYMHTGWERCLWDQAELVGLAEGCQQMIKAL